MTSPRSDASSATSSTTYTCLSFSFRVAASDANVAADFADVYGSCAAHDDSDPSPALLDLRDTDHERSASLQGMSPIHAADRHELLVVAAALVDRASVDASSRDLLLIHASAVMTGRGPVLLVGPSGAGKSTLAAALTRRGRPYLGDEVLGLDGAATQLFANPKPLKLDRRARAALFDDEPDGFEAADRDGEALVAPHALGPVVGPGAVGAPVAVVHIAYQPGARAEIAPMSRAEVAEAVADQCFNFAQWGARGLDTVAALARACPGFRLTFGRLDDAIARLDEVLP